MTREVGPWERVLTWPALRRLDQPRVASDKPAGADAATTNAIVAAASAARTSFADVLFMYRLVSPLAVDAPDNDSARRMVPQGPRWVTRQRSTGRGQARPSSRPRSDESPPTG